ncbi:hypothetical protein CUMW_027310 [Citrus unshiu]|nr:hypothetical protein CUMW_027310 [Citrus unshiu]
MTVIYNVKLGTLVKAKALATAPFSLHCVHAFTLVALRRNGRHHPKSAPPVWVHVISAATYVATASVRLSLKVVKDFVIILVPNICVNVHMIAKLRATIYAS